MDVEQVPEVIKFLATLGVGGVLAGLIFWFYRKDSLEHAAQWRGQSEALIEVVKDNTSAITALQVTTSALHTATEELRRELRQR